METLSVRNRALLDAALDGLSQPQKRLSPKWLYDTEGSRLFEQITDLPEYYPTRTEAALLRRVVGDLARVLPSGAELVELGAGASVKTRILLDRLDLARYSPIDIAEDFLAETAAGLRDIYPDIAIRPLVADFTAPVRLPDPAGPRIAFFPGSTLGNLDPADATALLSHVRDWSGIAGFVLGIDRVKDLGTLLAAYDDAAGVTAAFNRNLLTRMNREIGADFEVADFRHRAIWNPEAAAVEMHLEASRAMVVRIGERRIPFAAGETIHTESSRKFTDERLTELADATGWTIAALHTDPDGHFYLAHLVPGPGG